MISLDDCFNLHRDTAVLVPGGGAGNDGQCLQWVSLVHHDVYGHPYVYTPAARDWWYRAEDLGLTEWYYKIPSTQPIIKGDFVIYNPLSIGDPEGHIDVASKDGTANDFWAYDSNWNAAIYYVEISKNGVKKRYPSLHEVHHNDRFNKFIIGYLRPKGGSTVDPQLTSTDQVRKIYLEYGISVAGSDPVLQKWINDNGTELQLRRGIAAQVQNTIKVLKASTGGAVTKASVLNYINAHLT